MHTHTISNCYYYFLSLFVLHAISQCTLHYQSYHSLLVKYYDGLLGRYLVQCY